MFFNPKVWGEYAERYNDENILNLPENYYVSFTYKHESVTICDVLKIQKNPPKYRIEYTPNMIIAFAMYQLISDENSSFHMEDLELLYVMPKELKPYYVCFLTYKYGLDKSSEFYYYLPKLEISKMTELLNKFKCMNEFVVNEVAEK